MTDPQILTTIGSTVAFNSFLNSLIGFSLASFVFLLFLKAVIRRERKVIEKVIEQNHEQLITAQKVLIEVGKRLESQTTPAEEKMEDDFFSKASRKGHA